MTSSSMQQTKPSQAASVLKYNEKQAQQVSDR